MSGNRILDTRTGEPWIPHAVNWPSFEYACRQGWGYSQGGATDAAAAAMVTWGINAVRLPLNEQCWLGVEGAPAYGTVAGYRAAVRTWVDALNAHGIVVILDLHWSAPVGKIADGQRPMTGTRSVLFWQSVAAAFSKVPSVIFDPFNEPYSRGGFSLTWACWKNGGCQAPVENDVTAVSGSTFTLVGMKTLVTTIRRAGATQPIMLAGLDYANDLRGWLANRPTDAQLIASWHNYPGQRCHTLECWNAEIVPVAAVVPVIASEFGQTDGGKLLPHDVHDLGRRARDRLRAMGVVGRRRLGVGAVEPLRPHHRQRDIRAQGAVGHGVPRSPGDDAAARRAAAAAAAEPVGRRHAGRSRRRAAGPGRAGRGCEVADARAGRARPGHPRRSSRRLRPLRLRARSSSRSPRSGSGTASS